MPVHDWTRVKAGIFHHFHHEWISEISRALNRSLHGTNYYALAEQLTGDWGPDVLTLQRPAPGGKKGRKSPAPSPSSAVALADSPPKVRYQVTDEKKWYAAKKKDVTIRYVSEHDLVAVLEVLSPGIKSSRGAVDEFVHKAHSLLRAGIHFAAVDVFPPTRRDPEGIHPLLWGDDDEDSFRFDPAKPLTCASYVGSSLARGFIETVGVGDVLPNLPLFLLSDEYVPVPLEETYQAAFDAVPDFWREALTTRKA
jgi:hypothetical protein